ncbi:mRNA triphosphatase CET1 [Massarina eburnea CBS 473.64]|uniref:mRNA-capping enzyme subunit beta n=1 Tax=Massarina eburnea CBS 473.64 TaxID=1395130 RepID=A0A6A6S292_9PLEO|nr:mRNA triphosphatase CET1 [Massarina eburnea CBS 473.64]
MDIRQLVNPVTEAPARRSLSGSHNILTPSPAISHANLPTQTPPHAPPATNRTTMTGKRKRHDPKPIWAYRETEIDADGNTLNKHLVKIEQSRPAPAPAPVPVSAEAPAPQPQARPPPPAAHNGAPPPHANGNAAKAAPPGSSHGLAGYARPISDDAEVYDDPTRAVCDFIWTSVIDNPTVRAAIDESSDTQVEVEARWGQIQGRADGQRLRGIHRTECVVDPALTSESTKFESTMTMEQHKKMNVYLNTQVQKSTNNAAREPVTYKHTREIDQQYELSQDGFNRLSPKVRQLIASTRQKARIRVTRDMKNPSTILGALLKIRIDNLEISSPQTEWDYRIGVNLEIKFPGPLDGLQPVVEKDRTVEEMKRYKDRVSYSWAKAYQIDLTQVTSGKSKNHELELELNSDVLLKNGEYTRHTGQPSKYEALINGMMNNLRVLSREITPQ